MKNLVYSFGITMMVFLGACDSRTDAERIIDKSIAASGGKKYDLAKIEFDFRNIHYSIFKNKNGFEYIRLFSDSTGMIRDLLDNSGFLRTVNGVKIDSLSEERIGAFSRSVNSVAYFAFLPFGLNDSAAIKTYLGETDLKGETYHLIKVTFLKEGGGEDFDDEFLYWIGKDDFFIDFMAYSYHTDGGGIRMREVSNVQEVNGIRFQNYLNLKPKDKNIKVEEIQALYEKGELELLSEINLENIKVEIVQK